MIGQRPRQAYFKELQDAVINLQDQYAGLKDGATKEPYKDATEDIYRYPVGNSYFRVEEAVNTGYPTTDGIVETLHVDRFRNIQHFFTQEAGEVSGATYTRQWKEEFRQWSPWIKLLTSEDLKEHLEDQSSHLHEVDRYRLLGYRHEQINASAEWDIEHHLDKYPSVSITDSGGTIVVGEVRYIDTNRVKVSFSAPFSGKAYLS